MRKKYVGLGIVILIFGVFFIPKIIDRIKQNATVENDRASASPLSFIKINEEAKKVPDFLFLNQDSLWISNDDFKGKVYVAEFFFTRCPTICPIMNKNMKRIEAAFGTREDFGIASFSIDPEHDTPTILKTYVDLYDVFSQNWHFLTGKKEQVYDLANKGFNIFAAINPEVAGGFEHQGYFALIDKKGFIRSRTDAYGNPVVYYSGVDDDEGKSEDVDMLLEDIRKLLREP